MIEQVDEGVPSFEDLETEVVEEPIEIEPPEEMIEQVDEGVPSFEDLEAEVVEEPIEIEPPTEVGETVLEKEFFEEEAAEPVAEVVPEPTVEEVIPEPVVAPTLPVAPKKFPLGKVAGIVLAIAVVGVVLAYFGGLFPGIPAVVTPPTIPTTPAPTPLPTPTPAVGDKAEQINKLIALGDQLFEDKKWATPLSQNAIDTYHEVLKLDPQNDRALVQLASLENSYLVRGSSAFSATDYNKSIRMYNRALRANPASSSAKAGRSKAYAMLKDMPPAPTPEPPPKPTPPPKIEPTPPKIEPTPSPTPPPASGGGLTKQQIKSTIGKYWGKVKVCIGWGKQNNPDLVGKCVIRFVIQPSGSVSSATVVSSTLGDAKTEQCLANRVLSMKFPPFEGSPKTVNFPFVVTK